MISKPQKLDRRQMVCLCKTEDIDKFFIQCDNCDQWYHGICVFITQSMSDHIKHWYCNGCAKETVWNPKCSKPNCADYQRNESLYCSDLCGLQVAHEKIEFKYKNFTLNKQGCGDISERKLKVKKSIRALEQKMLFLDDCIERVQKFRASKAFGMLDRQKCGFNKLFITIEFEYLSRDDIIDQNTDTLENDESCCQNNGKCSKHSGWELIKSHEVQMELDSEIKKYKLLKKEELLSQAEYQYPLLTNL